MFEASWRAAWFRSSLNAVAKLIASDTTQSQIALLRILIATGDRALDAFQAADNPLDTNFVADLERIVERSKDELLALRQKQDAAAK